MEFRIDKEIFLKALQKVQGIIERRSSMPILSNVLIEAGESDVTIIATDLEVGMKSVYPATVTTCGKITVGAKKLFEIVKEFPDLEITFISKENDWVEIKCGKVHFNIVGLSSEEFPYFPVIKDENLFGIEASVLRGMIDKTCFAICNDDTKYNLNGLFTKIEADDNDGLHLKMVATDGHRLSVADVPFTGKSSTELEKGVILPRKGVMELRKITDEEPDGILFFGLMDNSAAIRQDGTYMLMRLIDGEFPEYKRVIPVANDRTVVVNRENFMHSTRRMSIISSDKFKGIMLEISEKEMRISSSNPELGDATEEIDVKYEGEPFTVRFNARYILDVLAATETENIRMKFRDELSPSIILPENSDSFISVIMPMRL